VKRTLYKTIHAGKFIGLFIFLLLSTRLSHGQTVTITSPSTLIYGSNLAATATTSTVALGVNYVSFNFNSVTTQDASFPYGVNFVTNTLVPGTYTLSAFMNYNSVSGAVNSATFTQTVTIIPTTPTASATSICGSGTSTITVGGGLPTSGTYRLYAAATGGTALSTGAGNTLTSPTISATTTYYVAYAYNSVESARTAVTATVNPLPSSVISGPAALTLGASGNYSVTAAAGVSYSWATNGGLPATGTGSSISVVWATSGTKTVTVTATNTSTGCTSTGTFNVTVTNPGFLSSYGFRIPVILNNAALNLTTDLTNFPVLVYIQDDALKITTGCDNKVQYPDGPVYDFAFTAAGSTTELNYDIEDYNKITGTLLVWVRVPTLVRTTNYSLTFYFGSLTANATNVKESTWPSDYLAVYHFNQAASATVLDATTNHVDGTPTNLTTATDRLHAALGLTGGGYSFNGTSKIIANKTANITGNFTLSAWVSATSPNGDNKVVSNEINFGPGYKLAVKSGVIETETRSTNTIGQLGNLGDGGAVTAGWHYIQGTFNGTSFQNYVNGVAATTTLTKTASSITPLAGSVVSIGIDNRSGTTPDENYYIGLMDEVRISNTVKSADWIKAEYTNQNNPAAFRTQSAYQTDFTNASTLKGGITYSTADGTNFTYTLNGITTAGTLPTNGNANVIITGAGATLPATTSVYGLTVNPSSTINLNGQTLNVGCNVYNNGSITNTTSSIVFNGTFTPQLYTAGATTNIAQFGNLTINNTATAGQVKISGGPVNIYNFLTLTNGSLNIDNTNNGSLTLKSTSNLIYAQIAPISAGRTIQGNINDEVLFQGGAGFRNYRAMAAPIYNNTTSYNSANGSYVLNGLKSTFIITGFNGTTNGFDASSNNGSTLRIYNPATNKYTYVSDLNTAVTVPSGSGYYMYYRGNRNATGTTTLADPFGSKTNKTLGGGSYAVAEALTFTYTGIPNQGNVNIVAIPAANTTSYYHVANPYAATLDAGALLTGASTYVNQFTWTWNPSKGSYAVYDLSTPSASTNNANRYVVPGQSFMVKANNTTGSAQTLTVTETMKSISNSANAIRFLKTSEPTPAETIELPVMKLQLARNKDIYEELALVLQPSAKDSIDNADAEQITGDHIVFTTITPDNKYLTIDKRPFNSITKMIPLYISTTTDTIYTFKHAYLSSLMDNYKVTLYDSLLNNQVEIAHNDYAVNIYKAQPTTWGGKRFKLIIQQISAPVTFYEFVGELTPAKNALLSWKTSDYRFGITYQVQRSQDNKTFTDAGAVQVGSAEILKNTFSITDNDVKKGINYYRLIQTDIFGNTLMSDTIQLEYNLDAIPSNNGFKLYPNPVTDNFNIISDKTYRGKITMRIFDSNSNLKYTKNVTQLNAYEPIQQYVSEFKLGVYIVELRDNKNHVLTTLKFVKQ